MTTVTVYCSIAHTAVCRSCRLAQLLQMLQLCATDAGVKQEVKQEERAADALGADAVLWRVNQQEFTRRMRADGVATHAALRHGDRAGAVVAAMLRRPDLGAAAQAAQPFRVSTCLVSMLKFCHVYLQISPWDPSLCLSSWLDVDHQTCISAHEFLTGHLQSSVDALGKSLGERELLRR